MKPQLHARRLLSALAIGLVLSASLAGVADARRGGGFGSRGMRTYSAPQSTFLSPGGAAPIQRSMTAPGTSPGGFQPYGTQPSYAPGYNTRPYYSPRPFGGGFMGGLLTGGLVGAMLGHGFGGGWGGYGGGGMGMGLVSLIFQLGILALIVWGVSRFFRRRGGFAPAQGPMPFAPSPFDVEPGPAYPGPWGGAPAGPPVRDEIGVGPADRAAFERLLGDMQDAFAREDYAALRNVCTPEIVSYLSEELSQNATHGRKNDVKDLKLLSMELSEAWREPDADYATAALRYESIDVMRDRQTGAVVEGDPDRPTQTTEIWTFVRKLTGPEAGRWKLSAIQDA